MTSIMCFALVLMQATALVQANECSTSRGECPDSDIAANTMSLLQTNLQVKDSQAAQATIKLIVNSDVRYDVALKSLFGSMRSASFSRWSDVVVMRGSASNDSHPFTPDTEYGKLGVTYIDMKLSSFDLHGFSGLYHHRNDPRVKANVYFYIHDTVRVDRSFPTIFNSMATTEEFEARHPPLPCKNQCVFGSGVVDTYGAHFDSPRTKTEGFLIEEGIAPYRNVVMFAKKSTELKGGKIETQAGDLYHTGHPRTGTHFPSLGITKYSFSNGFYGDLTGDLKKYAYWSL